MKKWEFFTVVAFFALFVILFFSVKQPEQPWQPKTSKVGEVTWIEDVGISVDSVSVDDRLTIWFRDGNRTTGFKEYEAGAGWKFVIIDIWIHVSESCNGSRTFSTSRVEDENGMTYDDYSLLENLEYYLGGTPYYGISRWYEGSINLPPGEGEFITVAYKMPTNAVPEKFYYSIYNSDSWYGAVILKK